MNTDQYKKIIPPEIRVRMARFFRNKYTRIALKVIGAILVLYLLWLIRIVFIWLFKALAGLMIAVGVIFIAVALFQAFKNKARPELKPVATGSGILIAGLLFFYSVNFVGNLILPTESNEDYLHQSPKSRKNKILKLVEQVDTPAAIDQMRIAFNTLGYEDIIVTRLDDGRLLVASHYQTKDRKLETMVKFASAASVVSRFEDKGDAVVVFIDNDGPVMAMQFDIKDAVNLGARNIEWTEFLNTVTIVEKDAIEGLLRARK